VSADRAVVWQAKRARQTEFGSIRRTVPGFSHTMDRPSLFRSGASRPTWNSSPVCAVLCSVLKRKRREFRECWRFG